MNQEEESSRCSSSADWEEDRQTVASFPNEDSFSPEQEVIPFDAHPRRAFPNGRKKGKKQLIGLAVLILFFLPSWFSHPGQPEKPEKESDLISYEHLLLGDQLPHMEDAHGQVITDSTDRLFLYFLGVDQERCDDYIRKCRASGFKEDECQLPGQLRFFNWEGYCLISSYIEPEEKLSVTLKAPFDFAPLSWPSAVVGDLIPDPQIKEGFIYHLSSGEIDIYLKDMTPGQFLNYQKSAEKAGFDREVQAAEGHFIAENANKSKLYLTDEGGHTVRLALKIAEPDRLLP